MRSMYVTKHQMNEDQGYPYATGYARSAMSDVADDLSAIVEQLRSEVK